MTDVIISFVPYCALLLTSRGRGRCDFQNSALTPKTLKVTVRSWRITHWKQPCLILRWSDDFITAPTLCQEFNSARKVKGVSGQSVAHLNWLAASCCCALLGSTRRALLLSTDSCTSLAWWSDAFLLRSTTSLKKIIKKKRVLVNMILFLCFTLEKGLKDLFSPPPSFRVTCTKDMIASLHSLYHDGCNPKWTE